MALMPNDPTEDRRVEERAIEERGVGHVLRLIDGTYFVLVWGESRRKEATWCDTASSLLRVWVCRDGYDKITFVGRSP